MPGSQDLKNTEASISDRSKGEAWGACPPPPLPPLYFDQTDFLGDWAPLFSKDLGDLPPLSQGLDPALHLAKAHFKCFKMMICLLLPLIIHYSRPAQNQLSCY